MDCQSGMVGCAKPLRRSQTIEPISRGFAHPSASNLYSTGVPCMKMCMPKELGAHILTCKKKNALDLKVFSWIGKTKHLKRIPNSIMNTRVLTCFDVYYISDGVKTALSTHGLGNI